MSKAMEETQHLSKYARKQQRLAEEKNFGTDYTKQIEQAEREQQEQQTETASKSTNNTLKLDAMRKHQRLKDKAIATIAQKKIEVQAFQMLLDCTPENDTNVRVMWAKKLCAAKQTIEQMTNARDIHLSKMKLIQQELKINEQ